MRGGLPFARLTRLVGQLGLEILEEPLNVSCSESECNAKAAADDLNRAGGIPMSTIAAPRQGQKPLGFSALS